MNKPSRKRKRAADQAHQRSKPRNKLTCITPAEARRCAEQYVIKRMFSGSQVLDGAKANWNVYDLTGKLTGRPVWLVYPKPDEPPLEFRASHIIAVCKRTGQVLYDVSAGDEG